MPGQGQNRLLVYFNENSKKIWVGAQNIKNSIDFFVPCWYYQSITQLIIPVRYHELRKNAIQKDRLFFLKALV